MSELHRTILQANKHVDTSDKYTHISTKLIIDSLEARGFEIENTKVAGVRKESNQGFQKHLVTMKYKELETKEGVPTVIIQNSHNRSSGLKFHTGFIRFACMNGLVLGDGINEQSIRHSSSWKDKAREFLNNYFEEVARMEREHEYLKSKTLTAYDQMFLAREAFKIRYKEECALDTNELNLVRRIEDRGNSAYKVYNRLQEALVQGHFTRRVLNDEGNWSEFGKAAKLTSTDEIIRVNKEVRELCLSVA